MNKQKDEKWLDELISRTINSTKPEFDAEQWKQKYPEEFKMLKSHSLRESLIVQPALWKIVLQSKLMKLAAAAVIIVAISLFMNHRGRREQKPPQVTNLTKSPAEMMTAISLNIAYRKGGMEAVEKQCNEAFKLLGPRPKRISIQELLAEFNGT